MYDWMVGLSDEEQDHVMRTHSKLKPIVKLDMGNIPNVAKCYKVGVATLTLGSWPKQGLAKVWVKSEVRESHFMLSGV